MAFVINFVKTINLFQVFTSQRVDYSGGRFYGHEMEQPTRTLLSFLISSVAGKYDDLVCFVPVVTLDSDLLKQHHKQVVEGLEKIGYKTLITITDNHKTNRKFFSSFANGDLLPQVPHPICSKRPHFLLFDPVHIMKNFYNNFQKKK